MVLMNIFYCAEYALPSGDETVTKSRRVAELITGNPDLGVNLCRPEPVTRAELLRIHSANYIDPILTGERTKLPPGDWSPALLQSLLFSSGGMRDAVQEALRSGVSGSLSAGLHHAARSRGWGLCTWNGLALATLVALEHIEKVGILDTDAHFGGGTFNILGANPRVHLCDIGVADLDEWEPTDTSRHHRVHVTHSRRYLGSVRAALQRLESVNFLIYDAGMDAHESAGGIPGITTSVIRKREQLVAQWCLERRIPVIFSLEGGYTVPLTLTEVAELHMETVRAFAGIARQLRGDGRVTEGTSKP